MKKFFAAFALTFAFLFVGNAVIPTSYVAADAKSQMTDALGKVNDNNQTDLGDGITKIINLLLFTIGAISTIAIIIGGILYVTSSGDQGKIQTAKNTILYAVIGLIVAILSYAIVNFVVTQFK